MRGQTTSSSSISSPAGPSSPTSRSVTARLPITRLAAHLREGVLPSVTSTRVLTSTISTDSTSRTTYSTASATVQALATGRWASWTSPASAEVGVKEEEVEDGEEETLKDPQADTPSCAPWLEVKGWSTVAVEDMAVVVVPRSKVAHVRVLSMVGGLKERHGCA